jgi:hypothetical protein
MFSSLRILAALSFAVVSSSPVGCGDSDDGGGLCTPDDADGVIGGDVAFDVTVDDERYSPSILTAQNRAKIALTLHNAGTTPHGFVIDCLDTPNDDGCPLKSCFADSSKIAAIAPGETASATFEVPLVEGIYFYHSDVMGDSPSPCYGGADGCGQFVVK